MNYTRNDECKEIIKKLQIILELKHKQELQLSQILPEKMIQSADEYYHQMSNYFNEYNAKKEFTPQNLLELRELLLFYKTNFE